MTVIAPKDAFDAAILKAMNPTVSCGICAAHMDYNDLPKHAEWHEHLRKAVDEGQCLD